MEGFRFSPQQKRIWGLRQQVSIPYCSQLVLQITGNLQADHLRTVLEQIACRYEILRTRLERPIGVKIPYQIIESVPKLRWNVKDLGEMKALALASVIREVTGTEREVFAASETPEILSAVLLRVEARSAYLVITVAAEFADRKSLVQLAHEIANAYAHITGEMESDTDLHYSQYADVAAVLNDLLEANEAETGKDHWRHLKPNLSSQIGIFAKRRLLSDGKGVIGRLERAIASIAPERAQRIIAFCAERQVSLECFFLCCWKTLLWRLSDRSDFVLGICRDGRSAEEVSEVIGPLSKYLPLPVSLREDASFLSLLQPAQLVLDEYSEWQEFFSWDDAGRAALENGDSSNSHTLFNALFEYDESGERAWGQDVRFQLEQLLSYPEPFHISLVVSRHRDSIETEWHYDAVGCTAREIEYLIERFFRLIEVISETPAVEIGQVEIVGKTERQQLVANTISVKQAPPRNLNVPTLFEQQALRTPDRLALVVDGQQLTYKELNQRANCLAQALRRRGVGPDVIVGLYLDRSVDAVVGFLGILKAGGAYAPLDPASPKIRLANQLRDLPARLLVSRESYLPELSAFGGEILCLDARTTILDADSETDRPTLTEPQNLAYVIYTSGSTGRPKGVGVTHQGLTNYTGSICRLLELDSEANAKGLHFAAVSTLSADLGNTAIFPALVSGGCLHLIPYEIATDSSRFCDYCVQHGIDVLKIVPTHLKALLASDDGALILPRKYLLLGGEALSWELVDRIKKTSANCKIFNHYGPTETTIGALTFEVSSQVEFQNVTKTAPIGTPIPNATALILDKHFNLVPLGTPGELFLGGDGVSRGYLGDPGLTAERYVPDPVSGIEGQRLYRTGDMVRLHSIESGTAIEFLGRVDQQIKIRGFRIEIGEIEAALREHANLSDVAVQAVEYEAGEPRLIAYYTMRQPAPVSTREWQEFLRPRVPEQMIPSSFVQLEALPITSNGKLDRSRLPKVERLAEDRAGEFVGAYSQQEQTMARLWAEALNVNVVGLHDNYFELGGDSILSIQIAARARKEGLSFAPMQLFRNPTIAALLAEIGPSGDSGKESSGSDGLVAPAPIRGSSLRDAQGWKAGVYSLLEQPEEAIEDIHPLSPMQQGMLFHSVFSPGEGLYLSQVTCRFDNGFDANAFEKAWHKVVERHSIFRSAFIWEGLDEPAQVVYRSVRLPSAQLDWRQYSDAEQEVLLTAFLRDEYERDLDFSAAPLMHIAHIRLRDDTYQFVWTYHHMLMDAWSESLVMTEVLSLYEDYCQLQPAVLPAPRPYGAYIDWLQQQDLRLAEDYWRRIFTGFTGPVRLRLDHLHSGATPAASDYAESRTILSAEKTQAVKDGARRAHLTVSNVVQGCWALLLSHYSGSDDVVFGLNVSGRPATLPGVETIVGLFINTLPVRVVLPKQASLRAWLKEIQEQQAEMKQYEYSPLVQLQAWSGVPQGISLFESILVFQNAPSTSEPRRTSEKERASLQAKDVRFKGGWTNYPLALDVKPSSEMVLNLSHDQSRFSSSAARRLVRGLEHLLGFFAANPEVEISELLASLRDADQGFEAEQERDAAIANLQKLSLARRKAIQLSLT